MSSSRRFPKEQCLLLKRLYECSEPLSYEDASSSLGLDQVHVAAAAQLLELEKLVALEVSSFMEVSAGKSFSSLKDGQLPEIILIRALQAAGKELTMAEMPAVSGLDQKIVGQTLKVLKDLGWAELEKGALKATAAGVEAVAAAAKRPESTLISACAAQEFVLFEEAEFSAVKATASALEKRDLLKVKERKRRFVSLTEQGRAAVEAGISELVEVTALTEELLRENRWKEVRFKPYNIVDACEPVHPGKIHPFLRIIAETKRTFLDLGFEEVASPHAESSFWDFDALFQPQDHPARDMQDTFYLKRPGRASLPDKALVEKVRATHESGGDTGSTGWGYTWNMNLAEKTVLRTHTTAATIRALHKNPAAPRKVFCVGRVFRRETIDYKHLPVFYQVDGIVVDKQASLSHLIWVLSEFYRKMGFEKIEVRPSFFPYTEPSLEVFVFLPQKNEWVEMGGAGIFRPEVTEPMGCTSPVLAFGLGLERLAMFRYQLKDIREIYLSSIKWLREVPLCP